MNYRNLQEFTNYDEIKTCWNQEVGYIYPISKQLFLSSVKNNKDLLKNNSYVVLDQDEVVAFILTKVWTDSFEFSNYKDIGWISLFYVKRKFRHIGIGTKLLQLVENKFQELNKKRIVLGRDTFNFFPGLPSDFVNYRKWFIKHGFEFTDVSYDMIRYFKQTKEKLPLFNSPYTIRMANKDDEDKIITFFERCFPGRWEFEAKSYFSTRGTGREFVIILDGKKVIAFARINDKASTQNMYNINWSLRFHNLAGVGPLGVDKDYRKQNLGYLATAYAINEVIKRGYGTCIIDWTGLVDFYHLFKFEVWKSFDKLEKKLY